MNQQQKAALLRRLHQGPEILVLPNAWDAGSARIVAAEGFPVIATSSSGCAGVLGYADGQLIPRAEMLFLIRKIAGAVDVPVTADVEAGYDDVARTAIEVLEAGAVGLNLEDCAASAFFPIREQAERLRQVRAAADSTGIPLVINARTDIYLSENGDPATRFDRTVERLNAWLECGADCFFVPGVRDAATIARLVTAVPAPINVLAVPGSPSIAELQSLGVARVSLGGGPSRVAMGCLRRFARELRESGTFGALRDTAVPSKEMQELLARG